MQVTRRSPFSGKTHTMELAITEEELQRWKAGELVQNVWPQLTADEREFIMTGITKEEWDAEFAEADDE